MHVTSASSRESLIMAVKNENGRFIEIFRILRQYFNLTLWAR